MLPYSSKKIAKFLLKVYLENCSFSILISCAYDRCNQKVTIPLCQSVSKKWIFPVFLMFCNWHLIAGKDLLQSANLQNINNFFLKNHEFKNTFKNS